MELFIIYIVGFIVTAFSYFVLLKEPNNKYTELTCVLWFVMIPLYWLYLGLDKLFIYTKQGR